MAQVSSRPSNGWSPFFDPKGGGIRVADSRFDGLRIRRSRFDTSVCCARCWMGSSVSEGWTRKRAPNWLRQCGRAAIALSLGVFVGLSAAQPEVLLVVSAFILMLLVTASLTKPDPLVFVAFALLTMPKVHIPGSPLPMGETLMLLAVASAFLTLKSGLFTMPRWSRLLLGAFVGALVLSALVNGLLSYTMFKRLLHIAVYALVIIGLVRGLLPRRAALRGLVVGLVISVTIGLILFPKSRYAGRYTGLFGDPNVAGLLLVVLGLIALTGITTRRNRIIFVGLLLPALALTYSRTAFLAAMVSVLWLVIGRKLKPIPALFVVVAVAVTIAVLPTSLQSIGPFSDRTGSDLLRDRVAAQEIDLISEKPILGHGPGTATVLVNQGTTTFYFHNSYFAMIQEGGIVSLVTVMTLLIGTFLALMSLDTTDRQPLLEAAIIGVWVMSINLGEVLLELSTAVTIGMALAYIVRVRSRTVTSPSAAVPAAA